MSGLLSSLPHVLFVHRSHGTGVADMPNKTTVHGWCQKTLLVMHYITGVPIHKHHNRQTHCRIGLSLFLSLCLNEKEFWTNLLCISFNWSSVSVKGRQWLHCVMGGELSWWLTNAKLGHNSSWHRSWSMSREPNLGSTSPWLCVKHRWWWRWKAHTAEFKILRSSCFSLHLWSISFPICQNEDET